MRARDRACARALSHARSRSRLRARTRTRTSSPADLSLRAAVFVNLNYGSEAWLPNFFWHGITYMSGPDLVEPAFHFCVGFALRLVLPRRIEAARHAGAAGYLAPRWAVLRTLLATRVAGLIVVSMFFTEGWASFDSWSDVGGLRDWLTQVVQSVKPYHTLLHIALITVWAFPALASESWRARAAMLVFTCALHCVLLTTFYFQWIHDYGLDEGGYFAFVGWSIEALTGALAHDLVAGALRAEQEAGGAREELAAPLLDHALVLPPFAVPDAERNVVTAWTMTQRAGSATYHLFTAGTSAVILACLVAASELGCAAPRWWRRGGAAARAASAALGLRTVAVEGGGEASVLLFHSHVFEVFGENALAIYIAGDQVGDAVQDMIPDDAPPWYFLCFGEATYIGVLFVVASYLRAHKLFLRL